MVNNTTRRKNDKTGIVKRIDYIAHTDKVYDVAFFCATCDPYGKGGHGGNIENYKHDDWQEKMPEYHMYCPTCGKVLDWNDIKITYGDK